MDLRVIKKFNGKAEGKLLCPGDVIQSNDVDRINALVRRGFCVIIALDNTVPETQTKSTEKEDSATVDFHGSMFSIEAVKAALRTIGVSVAPSAKEKAVSKALSTLTDEQAQALAEALSDVGNDDVNNE